MPLYSHFRLAGEGSPASGAVPNAAHNAVYVIDDHQAMRQSLDMLLGTLGIATRLFASAREFLDQLPSLVPAPLLLDITMPGMTGFELLETLVGRKITWPVLIMTGLNDEPLARRALALGAMAVLEKPFAAEDLESALSRALLAMTQGGAAPRTGTFDAAH
ncbi:MAG: Twocomponent nitrogen fixation transcriptional regulator FixJ [Caulobacteraceae bacterium]|nr:Twocomponent nitrogen fixation transcriptional regulator FixJ [Caulobacteraceae bacterium]